MLEFSPYLNSLNEIPGIRAGWVGRLPTIPVKGDRRQAMSRLLKDHQRAVSLFANGEDVAWWRAEQVHGSEIAIVPGAATEPDFDSVPQIPGVDGMISGGDEGVILSIYVADCAAIWLVDQRMKALGLLHSGKKGTEANILGRAVQQMTERFSSDPGDLVVVVSPCIRRPEYEVDFAGEIARQAGRAGVGQFLDCGINTARDLSRYYSYRKESGKTGRMMALLMRRPDSTS